MLAPAATISSCTRTRLPLQPGNSSRMCSRYGSADSARTISGTSAVPAVRTSLTAPREIPSARAIARVPLPSSRSRRIAMRVLWSSIVQLLSQALDQPLHLAAPVREDVSDLVPLGLEQLAQVTSSRPLVGASREAAERAEVGQ